MYLGQHRDAVFAQPGYCIEGKYTVRSAAIGHDLLTGITALAETDPQRKLTALLALARTYERTNKGEVPDIDTPIPNWDNLQLDDERLNVNGGVIALGHPMGATIAPVVAAIDDRYRAMILSVSSVMSVHGATRGSGVA